MTTIKASVRSLARTERVAFDPDRPVSTGVHSASG